MAQHKTLSFEFTPVDSPHADVPNPLAKSTTNVQEVLQALREKFGDDIGEETLYANEHTVLVSSNRIVDVCLFLRDHHGFDYLVDIGGVDRFTEEDRFEVFYNIVSIEGRKRIRIKVRVDEEAPVVPSLTGVYRAANWNERECWDMLGVRFDGHPDMRRMYLPEDFEYHPIRKEFPLLGIPGSLPLPAQIPGGELTMDPFAAAHGSRPVKSFEEPRVEPDDE